VALLRQFARRVIRQYGVRLEGVADGKPGAGRQRHGEKTKHGAVKNIQKNVMQQKTFVLAQRCECHSKSTSFW
jgi:hypothetical protein